jgi:hypothetical protein
MSYNRHTGAGATPSRNSLNLETLESRLNLSTLTSIPLPTLSSSVPTRVVGAPSSGTAAHLAAGATQVAGATTVAIDSYSGISNCQVVYANGQPVVGATSGNDGYVEYTVTAPAAGAYSVGVALAAPNGAGVRVMTNGKAAPADIWTSATDSWSTLVSGNVTVQLAAGANVIRVATLYGTRYTLSSLTVTPIGNPAAPPPAADSSAGPTSVVKDQNWLSIAATSASWNFTLQQGRWGPALVSSSSTGAYVDYSINVVTAGTYTLRSGIATVGGGTINVLVNGAQATAYTISTTNSEDSFAQFAQTVTLAAGRQTLRFSANTGTRFNLNSIELSRQTTPATPAAPAPTPDPTPTPVPVSPPVTVVNPVSVTQHWMTSFMELDVIGTSGDDAIVISQDGATYTITSGGKTQTVTGNFGEIVVHGGDGNDLLSIAGSVRAATRLYGDAGSDTLLDLGQGKATLVTLGGGADVATGNGTNTSYWADGKDTVRASAQETADGRVHVISDFYQPWTNGKGNSNYITSEPDGLNIQDPAADAASWTRLTNSSLWGTGPSSDDINQGAVSDCYFITVLQDLARLRPNAVREMAVDLGDGTYAVQFQRNGVNTFVRVDGDLPMNQWGTLTYNRLGASGDQWVSIMEKAYAYYRTGSNSYSSLNWGWMTAVYSDLGISSNSFAMTDQTSFYNFVTTQLAANKGVDIGTIGTISYATPLIANHTYSVVGAAWDAYGMVQVTLRNPWGLDGFVTDSNAYDGLLTMSFTVLKTNTLSGVAMA